MARFWKDYWLEDGRWLQSYTFSTITENILNECVANFVDNNGAWNWDCFASFLPHHIILKIAGIMPPSVSGKVDCCCWGPSGSGSFSVRSAYLSLFRLMLNENNSLWVLIWIWRGPQSIQCFLWLLMHNILKNNAKLSRRHVLNDNTCMQCGHIIEDALHAVGDYVDSKRIWLALISKHTSHTCFTLDVRSWIVYNMKNHLRITNEKDRSMLFGVMSGACGIGAISSFMLTNQTAFTT